MSVEQLEQEIMGVPTDNDIRDAFAVAREWQDPYEHSQPRNADYPRNNVQEFVYHKQQDQPLHELPIAVYSLYQPLQDGNDIRVFVVSPGSFDAPVQGYLQHVSVEFEYAPDNNDPRWTRFTRHAVSFSSGQAVCYTALSYVWGSAVFDRTIHVGGREKTITQSLDSAIRHLRDADHSVVLWIDQICINQDDMADKESQIRLMGLIYMRAWNTVIWLGHEAEKGAFRALQGLSEATMYRNDDLLDYELDYLRRPLNEEPEVFEALVSLFERPWFKRTWTVQEAILSRNPYIMTGFSVCHWDNFAGYCVGIRKLGVFDLHKRALNSASLEAIGGPGFPKIYGSDVAAQLWITRSYYHSLVTKANILDTLVDTRYAEVSNPLDKVYGILGLCENNILPTYSITVAELFKHVTAQYTRRTLENIQKQKEAGGTDLRICQHVVFRVLCCIDHDPGDAFALGIPSWCPDWSRPRLTTSFGFHSASIGIYCAGGQTVEEVACIDMDERCLKMKLRLCGTIDTLSSTITDAHLDANNLRDNKGLKSCIQFALNGKGTAGDTDVTGPGHLRYKKLTEFPEQQLGPVEEDALSGQHLPAYVVREGGSPDELPVLSTWGGYRTSHPRSCAP